jgi:hypothetical protein
MPCKALEADGARSGAEITPKIPKIPIDRFGVAVQLMSIYSGTETRRGNLKPGNNLGNATATEPPVRRKRL